MTKEEVRVVTVSKLDLKEDDTVIDIGAGTGSISIECARILQKGRVIAVERNQEGIDLIHQNIKKFQLTNIEVIQTLAPEGLEHLEVDKVIIGGSGGQMKVLFEWIQKKAKKVVINTITIENTYKAIELMRQFDYKNLEVTSLQVSKGKDLGTMTMMLGQNPVYIISGEVNHER